MRLFKSVVSVLLSGQMIWANVAWSQSTSDTFQIRKEEPSFRGGGVYYTPNKKNDVLFRANVWGSVQFPGVHYLPLGTRFLEGLSIAGGPLDTADPETIQLRSSKAADGSQKVLTIAVKDAMVNPDLNPVLQPDDIIFVKEDRSAQKASLWIQVATLILAAASFAVVVSRD